MRCPPCAACRASATASRARTTGTSAWSCCSGGAAGRVGLSVRACVGLTTTPTCVRAVRTAPHAARSLCTCACSYARKHFPSTRYLDYAITVEEYTLQKVSGHFSSRAGRRGYGKPRTARRRRCAVEGWRGGTAHLPGTAYPRAPPHNASIASHAAATTRRPPTWCSMWTAALAPSSWTCCRQVGGQGTAAAVASTAAAAVASAAALPLLPATLPPRLLICCCRCLTVAW